MSKIGIGIVTYNRLEYLRNCVQGVRQFTTSPFHIVVADDGSTDGSREWCRSEGIEVIGLGNQGVCWNKNRALFALQEAGCDPILLLEDDCWPIAPGWDHDWRVATALFGHVSYAHPKLAKWTLSGSGRPTDPYVNNKATAQCSSISALLMRKVGFFDSRFKGYGVGHAEWTTRIKKAGSGFKWAEIEDGRRARANLYIHGGVKGHDAPTFKDRENVARNEALFDRLKQEPIYRHPWSSAEEQASFAREMLELGISLDGYLHATTEESGPLQRLAYAPPIRDALDSVLSDEAGFAMAGRWVEGIAGNVPLIGTELAPELNYAMLHFLQERMQPLWTVLAFGAGYSTAWWSRQADFVHAFEEDEERAAMARRLAEPGKARVTQARAAELPGMAAALHGPFDVVVLDCPNGPAYATVALQLLAKTGVLVINHAGRPEYADVLVKLKETGLRELRLVGPAPGSPRMVTSSVIYAPDNCLGL
ncbi:glycosyltransferase [Roseococcus sp. SDR]|uniref:glycosyltransferase n=1 Tax=Roseococcus sp. SDR TaxID=2835532 RepID=UPI001BCC7327|nr:glycosyltransferase [Roseococcus sp. SDR]MBS7791919.1 glycosyltransferase [Roseococcus sp. SDR]MBV1847233.1 glycosyltransferase [Roseococcus sp. SDR]